MKYKKKPVVIEAFQFYVDEMPDWFVDYINSGKVILKNCHKEVYSPSEAYCIINTLEGEMMARGKDYIIKGVQGEFYPCKPDIFETTYEKM